MNSDEAAEELQVAICAAVNNLQGGVITDMQAEITKMAKRIA
jgi:hypothetical protein